MKCSLVNDHCFIRALEDRDRMRTAFSLLLAVPLDIEEDDKYNLEQVLVTPYNVNNL